MSGLQKEKEMNRKKKNFTVQDILNFNPCLEYTEERITELFKSVGCKKYITRDKLFKVDIPYNDFFWLILRKDFIAESQLHEIAIWCFEKIAQPIWEQYYPDDKCPQEAIRIKKSWLEDKETLDDLIAAGDAAGAAAWAAAYFVVAARVAAGDAAGDAVRDAAGDAAAYAAGDAAWAYDLVVAVAAARAAARAAAGAAAVAAIKNQIQKMLKKSKSFIKKGEK